MGSLISRLIWGGDPDQIDPVSGLSRRDIYVVQRSWALVYADATKYGMLIFIRLFKIDPPTQQLFEALKHLTDKELQTSKEFKAHALNVMSMINGSVHNLHQPYTIIALMNKLGETHQRHKVTKEYFLEAKEVILGILKNDLKSSEQVLHSWARYIDFIYTPLLKLAYDNPN